MYVVFRPRRPYDLWCEAFDTERPYSYRCRMGNGWPIAIVWKRLPVRKSPTAPVVAKSWEGDKGCQIYAHYQPFIADMPDGAMQKATGAQVNSIMGRTYPEGSGPISGPYLLHWLNSENADRSTYDDKRGWQAECYALPSEVLLPSPLPSPSRSHMEEGTA